MTPTIEIVLWIIAVVLGFGCGLMIWEHLLNMKMVPPEKRPKIFLNDHFIEYQLYSGIALVIVPLFGVWKWGWIGLFSYQVYPGACLLLGIIFYFSYNFYRKITGKDA